MPHSSYIYNIDDEYIKRVTNDFWSKILFGGEQYPPLYDYEVFDIDCDGSVDHLVLGDGPTSGLFTFRLTILENPISEHTGVFYYQLYDLCFEWI